METIANEAGKALKLISERNKQLLRSIPDGRAHLFKSQLEIWFPELFRNAFDLYGHRWDFFFHIEQLFQSLVTAYANRPELQIQTDLQRVDQPQWFQDRSMVGAMLYIDRFAGTIGNLKSKLNYIQELGIRYLHLMPLFSVPKSENDGGYAISSYREVNPQLGTIKDLAELAEEMKRRNICLVLDFVFNHTSDEHDWAKMAKNGNQEYRDFYYMFPHEHEMLEYNRHLRDIFPDVRQGSFTYEYQTSSWVWTTFHNYQWDLNYSNPAVFRAMTEEMLFLANLGVDVLRLDALAFVWKEKGTMCENLPKAHTLIRCFRAAAGIAAPGLLFKSEAIVHPDEVCTYISPKECALSYNPLTMALLWESCATRKTELLEHAMEKRYSIDTSCSWINYIRCHDDIGWTFADEDAAEIGIHGSDHRAFLNSFYTNTFPGSFARGIPFQYNPLTGDCRISGTSASLSGIESGLSELTSEANSIRLELGVRRHLLLHGIMLSLSGIPVLYLGDEYAQLNWYDYAQFSEYRHDSRWVHRPPFDWAGIANLQPHQLRIQHAIRKAIAIRTSHQAFSHSATKILRTVNKHILCYCVGNEENSILIISNFSESSQLVPSNIFRFNGFWPDPVLLYSNYELPTKAHNLISLEHEFQIEPLGHVWFEFEKVPD